MGFTLGNNKNIIPFVESGFNVGIFNEEDLNWVEKLPGYYLQIKNEQKTRLFIIPIEAGLKFPFMKNIAASVGLLYEILFGWDYGKHIENQLGFKFGFTALYF